MGLCKPCLARKRRRPATRVVAGEPFCDACYLGEGTPDEQRHSTSEKKKAYDREYQKRNRKAHLARQARYAAKNRAKIAAYLRKYRADRLEQRREYDREYYKRNRDKILKGQRDRSKRNERK